MQCVVVVVVVCVCVCVCVCVHGYGCVFCFTANPQWQFLDSTLVCNQSFLQPSNSSSRAHAWQSRVEFVVTFWVVDFEVVWRYNSVSHWSIPQYDPTNFVSPCGPKTRIAPPTNQQSPEMSQLAKSYESCRYAIPKYSHTVIRNRHCAFHKRVDVHYTEWYFCNDHVAMVPNHNLQYLDSEIVVDTWFHWSDLPTNLFRHVASSMVWLEMFSNHCWRNWWWWYCCCCCWNNWLLLLLSLCSNYIPVGRYVNEPDCDVGHVPWP